MGIYKYRFESILKFRNSVENNKKNLLSISIRKLDKEKKRIRKIKQRS